LITELADFDVVRIRADNGGPLTGTGTNTYVIGRDPAWVVDPGPVLAEHLDAIEAVVAARGGAGGIVATHGHADHTAAIGALAARLGVAAGDPGPLETVPLPGHADDHVVFVWNRVCCAGDCVLGEGSVFVAGDMAAYLDGLRGLRERDLGLICPGHGEPILDPRAKLTEYLDHRLDRERRLKEALAQGVRGEDALLDAVWDDAPRFLRPAAALTMYSHLRKLRDEGDLPGDVDTPPQPDIPDI
jgi:glyoxylase-like metal-dependent hydrolase (beta-lactamase superfamily II)